MVFFNLIGSKLTSSNECFKSGSVTFLNLYSYMMNRKNSDVFKSFDYVGVDGAMLVLAFRAIGVKVVRLSFDFTSIANRFFESCCSDKKTLYVVGSEQKHIEKFVSKISDRYLGINVAGYRNGYFTNEEERELEFSKIINSGADYLLVGMGSPFQEEFVAGLKRKGWSGNAITCGGFIHQTAGSGGDDYYPKIFDKLNIRWVYRIYDEPVLFKRYFLEYPKALILFAFDAIHSKIVRQL